MANSREDQVAVLPNRLLAAGSNARGQLANGTNEDSHRLWPCVFRTENSTSCDMPPGTRSVVKIAGGSNHTLLLLDIHAIEIPTSIPSDSLRRQLWVCGDGSVGQLSFNNPPEQSDRDLNAFTLCQPSFCEEATSIYTISDISAAWETSYVAIKAEGKNDVVLSCGSNDFGGLGIGNIPSASQHLHTVTFHHMFTDEELGSNLINIGKLTSGPRHNLALLRLVKKGVVIKTRLAGWGACRHGELGQRNELGLKGKPLSFLTSPSRVYVEHEEEDPIVDVAAGNQHTLVLHQSGRVSAMGSDRYGQISSVRQWSSVKSIGCTWNGSYAIRSDLHTGILQALVAGNNAHGQLGSEDASSRIHDHNLEDENSEAFSIKLACGSEHVLVLSPFYLERRSTVRGWGWNEHGNLGLGHTEDVRRIEVIDISEHTNEGSLSPTGVWAGCGTSWIALGGVRGT